MNKERFKQYLETGANLTALGVIASVTFSAFTRTRRKEILERDHHQCTICGATTHLEASHRDHERKKGYNDLENGETLDTRCHYFFHLNYRDFPEDIGLSVTHNDQAIKSLYKRMPKKWRDSVPDPDCTDDELRNWNELVYGDPDFWINRDIEDPYIVEDWPIQQELPNFSEVYSNRKKRV